VLRLHSDPWQQKDWLLHYDDTLFFTKEFFITNNMTVVPHPPCLPGLTPCNFSWFPRLKIKLKGCHFDTSELIEAESQVMLNTCTERIFQDAFKKVAKVLGTGHMCRRELL
jgi:hypothetical protein